MLVVLARPQPPTKYLPTSRLTSSLILSELADGFLALGAPHDPEIRGDFIRRLSAIAISVGFGAALARMKWLTAGTIPSFGEWSQIEILVVAMTATVLSWDGYLMSIHDKPLLGTWRFLIDVTLVFTYMILMMTSQHANFWMKSIRL
jgi:hypothetical protein